MNSRCVRSVLALVGTACLGACSTWDQTFGPANPSSTTAERRDRTNPPTGGGAAADAGAVARSLYFPTGQQGSSVLALQVNAPEQIKVAQPYQYDITVRNLTNAPLSGVVVREVMHQAGGGPSPDGATAESGAREEARAGGTGRWEIGMIPARESRTVHVDAREEQVGTAHHCYTVDFSPVACTTVQVVNPKLELTTLAPEGSLLCQELVRKYRITNTGTGTARTVRIIDQLPEGLFTTAGLNTVTLDVGDLPAGQTREVQSTLKAQRTGEFTTRATAMSADGEAQAEPIRVMVGAPELEMAVKAPEWEYMGKPLAFDVEVTNKGNAPAPNAAVTLEGVTTDGTNRKDLGTIPPGETRRMTINAGTPRVALAEDAETAPLRFAATATAECAKPVSQTVTTTLKTLTSLMFGAVDTVDPVRVGETTTYTIMVKNQGSAPARNLTLRAILPAEMQFVDATGASPVHAEGQKLEFAPIPRLGAGQEAAWRVNAKAMQEGSVQFQLEVKSDDMKEPAIKTEPTRLYR